MTRMIMRDCGVKRSGFETTIPVLEWDDASKWSELFAEHDDCLNAINDRLYDLERAYRSGCFDEAKTLATSLVDSDEDDAVKISALCTLFVTCVASGDADDAYAHLRVLYRLCSEGLKSSDAVMEGTSYMCAMRIENVLMANVFDIPEYDRGFDKVQSGMKAYLGYLLSLREIRNGDIRKASGIVYAFQKLMGPHYPLTRIGLSLVSASTALVEKRIDDAVDEFVRAWEIGSSNGVIMPFVEVNYLLLGLPRRCADQIEPHAYKTIESMVRSYHDGWFGLRKKCGLSTFGENLTPIEVYSVALAALGWRNKEIAQQLNVVESTVKHQLTSAYQKLGISSRSDLKRISHPFVYESSLVL